MTVRLFVYGTLRPDRDAWPVLEPWVVGDPQPDAVRGILYDTGRGYPAATFSAGADDLVLGHVVTLDEDRAAAAQDALDRYEGHEYRRVVVRTESGLEVATFAWIAPLEGCRPVAGGMWAQA